MKRTKPNIHFIWVFYFAMLCSVSCDDCGKSAQKIPKEDRIDLAMQMEFDRTKDLTLGYVPRERLVEANKVTNQFKKSDRHRSNEVIQWEERGPTNIAGRTRALIFDKADQFNNTLLAGGVAGGVWRGQFVFGDKPIWRNLTKGINNIAIGCLFQDPDDTNIIYAGTGEGWFNNDAVRGAGILKSMDGGVSWNIIPSTANSNFHFIQKIAQDKFGNLYACTRSNGVMKSSDQGNSWIKIIGSGVGGAFSDRASDIEITSDGVLFVSLGIYSFDGIYRSTDLGETWTYLHENGLPTNGFERIEIGISESDPTIVYTILESELDGGCLGIYRSDDNGNNWTSLPIPKSKSGLVFGRDQMWYNMSIVVDPTNPMHVIIGGINLYRSQNGGGEWRQLSNWFENNEHALVHADQHNILFAPNDNSRLAVANDGGIYTSTNIRFPQPAFHHRVSEYNVTQFYSCTFHPTLQGVIAGGNQDNGTIVWQDAKSNMGLKITGGDGGLTYFIGEQGSTLITSRPYNHFDIYFNYQFGREVIIPGGDFVSPTVSIGNEIYGAGRSQSNEYFRFSINSADEYKMIQVPAFNNQKISHISTSPSVANRLYFGMKSGRIIVVNDAHLDSERNGVEIFNQAGSISCIAIDEEDEAHMLVTISNYGAQNVWETTDGGDTWTNIENNLPDMPVRYVAFTPGESEEVLIATEAGVWRTSALNGEQTDWFPAQDFPTTRVDMITFQASTGHVAVATHGRGMFTSAHFEKFVGSRHAQQNIKKFKLYPNPTIDDLFLDSPLSKDAYYSIFNSAGAEVVNKKRLNSHRIQVSNLDQGLYFIYIYGDEAIYHSTFVKN